MLVRWRRLASTCVVATLVALSLLPLVQGTSLETAPSIPWPTPTDRALNDLGPADPNDNQRWYDCTQMSYRMIDDLSKTMHEGCFVTSAFGLMDPDEGIVIFNGTDEGEQIKLGSSIPALSPLPYSASVARFGGFPAEGTYMYLNTYFPSALHDSIDATLHRYKELDTGTNMVVTESSGQPMPVNPQALAYSARGQWMITESPGGALVRVNLATFAVLPFAQPFDVAGRPYAAHIAHMAITEDGRYAAVASDEFATLKIYDLATCTPADETYPLAPEKCRSYDYWPYVKGQITGELSSITHLRFINDGLLSFNATGSGVTESYELSPAGPITSLIGYLGLGDSYASGQGASDYVTGTDTNSNSCHLSSRSYPLLLSGDLFANAGHSVACSGATIHDVDDASDSYTGQTMDQRSVRSREADGSEVGILHAFTPGYLAQQAFVTSYQPGVITVGIGGNDVGFKDMLLRCASPVASVAHPQLEPDNCFTSYEDRLEVEKTIDHAYQPWLMLYRNLQRSAPAARIYAISYPQIVDNMGSCDFNVRLTSTDIDFTRNVITYINAVMAKAARAAGVQFVDISGALQGHELCDPGQAAMNGLTAGTDIYHVLSKESYHPTAFGQTLIEQAIIKATDHFAPKPQLPVNTNVPGPQPDEGDVLLQAPKTGRQITTTIPDGTMADDSVSKGTLLIIHISGLKDSLKPDTVYKVTIGGTTVGSIISDSLGQVNGSVPVPPEDTGLQPVTLTGPGQSGDTVEVGKVIDVDDGGQAGGSDAAGSNPPDCLPPTDSTQPSTFHCIEPPVVSSPPGGGSPGSPINSNLPQTTSPQPQFQGPLQSNIFPATDETILAAANNHKLVAKISSNQLHSGGLPIRSLAPPKMYTAGIASSKSPVPHPRLMYLTWYWWLLSLILVAILWWALANYKDVLSKKSNNRRHPAYAR